MRIEKECGYFGRTILRALPGPGDTHPRCPELILDYVVESVSDERAAVAAAIVFGDDCVASIGFGNPLPRRVVVAIEQYLGIGRVRVADQATEVMTAHSGDNCLRLCDHMGAAEPANRRGEPRVLDLVVCESAYYAGSLVSMNAMQIASNAFLHRAISLKGLSGWLPYVAVGVLLAQDLGADSLELPSGLRLEENETRALKDLLRSVELELIIP